MEQSLKEVLKTINDHTRVTYYVLPLLGLNKFSFGQNNFKNAYLRNDGKKLLVYIHDLNKVTSSRPYECEEYEGHNDLGFVYSMPGWFYDVSNFGPKGNDFERFKAGKYSHFTEYAKDLIRRFSGLSFKRPRTVYTKTGTPVTMYHTDARLLALERDDILRKALESYYDVEIDEQAELISPPDLAVEIHEWKVESEESPL